jgi:hypothetical protein
MVSVDTSWLRASRTGAYCSCNGQGWSLLQSCNPNPQPGSFKISIRLADLIPMLNTGFLLIKKKSSVFTYCDRRKPNLTIRLRSLAVKNRGAMISRLSRPCRASFPDCFAGKQY